MDSNTYANHLLNQIAVLNYTNLYLEDLVEKYPIYNPALSVTTEQLKDLWKQYYYYSTNYVDQINQDLENKILELKKYTDSINRIVDTVEKAKKTVGLVAELIALF